jgi:hypothetical protein
MVTIKSMFSEKITLSQKLNQHLSDRENLLNSLPCKHKISVSHNHFTIWRNIYYVATMAILNRGWGCETRSPKNHYNQNLLK